MLLITFFSRRDAYILIFCFRGFICNIFPPLSVTLFLDSCVGKERWKEKLYPDFARHCGRTVLSRNRVSVDALLIIML